MIDKVPLKDISEYAVLAYAERVILFNEEEVYARQNAANPSSFPIA